jgi:plastocyanin domain-containing protein
MRVWLLVLIVLAACEKKAEDSAKPKEVGTTAGTVAAGVRTIEIEASKDGYVPGRIAAKPGEKLKLIFTRRASGGECMAQLKTPDGKLVELTIDKPYEVEVTAPKDGEVKFACGMDMFTGVIVAEKA